ncbi:CPBP family intramembrane metalloprotease [bacterium]|nr:CPBP family intramembrane metalloprotease [bacterium]
MNESDHPSARICVGLVILSWFCAGLLTSLASFVLPQVDLILGEVLFILPAVFYVHRRGLSLSKTFRLNGIDKKMVGVCSLLGLSITVLVDELDRIIGTFIEVPPELEELISKALTIESFSHGAFVFVAVVLFAAVFEEMVFRGLLQQALERRLNLPNALFATALIFAFLHLFQPWIIQVLILGLILGYLAWRSNSVIPGILLHAINNAFALLFMNTQIAEMQWYNWNGHVNPPVLVVASAITYYGIRWFHRYTEEVPSNFEWT